MVNDRYRQQTSLSFSPELVSLLDDLRDETGINRSQLAERAIWYAVKACYLDYLMGGDVDNVRPFVTGKWIPFTSEAAGDIWYCSACGVGFAHHTKFCPHCGAYMKEIEGCDLDADDI